MSRRSSRTSADIIKDHNSRTLRRMQLRKLSGSDLDDWMEETASLLIGLISTMAEMVKSDASAARVLFRDDPDELALVEKFERAMRGMQSAIETTDSPGSAEHIKAIADSFDDALAMEETIETVMGAIETGVVPHSERIFAIFEKAWKAHGLDHDEVVAVTFPLRSRLATLRRKIRRTLNT